MNGMNYFAFSTAAKRYSIGRPFFHPLAAKKIRAVCSAKSRVDRALDVACGTGQSTHALLDVADEIVGLDDSEEMLSHAARHARIRYVEGRAEELPFANESFALLTVALAFHWFEARKFLHEARRVLRLGGWLALYNDTYTGQMADSPAFAAWNRESYLVRYPTPPRNHLLFGDFDGAEYGFAPSKFDQFVHNVEFTPNQLVDYLLTQTNVISAVEMGNEDVHSVTQWLLNSVQPFFRGATASFAFSCQMRFLERR
jgi:SAM-dependent methyltransferase